MVRKQRDLQRTLRLSSPWFLDLCALRHLYNNRRLFNNTPAKNIDFITAAGQVIWTEEIGIVSIPLLDSITIELHNIALAPKCNLSLILNGQLWESSIIYHNNPNTMILMQGDKTIAHTKKSYNLFIFELAMLGQAMSAISKTMAIKGQGQLTHLVSRNKCIYLWHWWLVYVSNTQVVNAFKLVDGIDLGLAKKYGLIEVFIDSDNLEDSGDNSRMRQTSGTEDSISQKVMDPRSTLQIRINDNNDTLNKLYTPCIGSKSTRSIQKNKNMTLSTSKLKKIYVNLWGPHDPLFKSGSTYAVILMCKHTWNTLTLYLWGKNNFINAFQS